MGISRADGPEDRAEAGRVDKVYRPEFLALDVARRAQAEVLARLGYGRAERPSCVRATGSRWRLRDYGGGARASLLVVAAPIKRPYVWDLAPCVSTVGYCVDLGFRVHLLEWTPPELGDEATGFDDYADAIGVAVGVATAAVGGAAPVLLGHSLGGTLATIFAACHWAPLAGLVLLGAPLCFGAGTSPLRDGVVNLAGRAPQPSELVPGSFLGQVSAVASPATFVWMRLADAAMSLAEPQALEVLLRVEHWALDEVALPGKFMGQVLDWLYREDRFRHGALPIKERCLGPHDLSAPTLAVIDAADGVAPRGAVEPFLRASAARSEVLEYPGETGVGLQHLALLVGREARARLWPQIVAWLDRAAAASEARSGDPPIAPAAAWMGARRP